MRIPRSAQEVLRQRFQLEAALASCPSPTGSMQSPQATPRLSAEPARERLALLVLLTRDLTPLEEDVCRLRYAGPAGGYAKHEGVVRSADAQLRELVPDALPELLTREGDAVTAVVRDEHGALTDFYAVEGIRAKPMGWAEIGAVLGISAREAAGLAGEAIHKASFTIRRIYAGLQDRVGTEEDSSCQ